MKKKTITTPWLTYEEGIISSWNCNNQYGRRNNYVCHNGLLDLYDFYSWGDVPTHKQIRFIFTTSSKGEWEVDRSEAPGEDGHLFGPLNFSISDGLTWGLPRGIPVRGHLWVEERES